MTFPYMVKIDGIYFNAGEEIPSKNIARDSSIPTEVKPEEDKAKAKKSSAKKTE